eukprot:12104-Heterococcus_DN1.PRE.6
MHREVVIAAITALLVARALRSCKLCMANACRRSTRLQSSCKYVVATNGAAHKSSIMSAHRTATIYTVKRCKQTNCYNDQLRNADKLLALCGVAAGTHTVIHLAAATTADVNP